MYRLAILSTICLTMCGGCRWFTSDELADANAINLRLEDEIIRLRAQNEGLHRQVAKLQEHIHHRQVETQRLDGSQ